MQDIALSDDEFTPSMTLLNSSGDITISWDAENQLEVTELVRKKMGEGYSFFIVREPGKRGRAARLAVYDNLAARAPNNSLDVSNTVGQVKVDDADLMIALQSNAIRFVRRSSTRAPQKSIRRAATPQEVVVSETVAVKPIVGG